MNKKIITVMPGREYRKQITISKVHSILKQLLKLKHTRNRLRGSIREHRATSVEALQDQENVLALVHTSKPTSVWRHVQFPESPEILN